MTDYQRGFEDALEIVDYWADAHLCGKPPDVKAFLLSLREAHQAAKEHRVAVVLKQLRL
ncbi:MAG TPA: hypothetical protein VNZ52_17015 [Candidatus Thermoplasmatota archaeon]|nr:hypothetical protein [Candidatus Thermoplasmatota archaeon]